MLKVYQTKFGSEGNCLMACIASLLQLRLQDLPDYSDEECWTVCQNVCLQHGYKLKKHTDDTTIPRGYSIAVSTEGPRGWGHACVAYDGEIIHDPHPRGNGLPEGIDEYLLLVPV